MADSILREKAKAFAKQLVFLCRNIKNEHRESVLTNQLLRAGTSIGANLHEAQYAQGNKDFISKLEIALKECNESEYWLELLYKTGYIDENTYKSLDSSCTSIRIMLISSIIPQRTIPNNNIYQDHSCQTLENPVFSRVFSFGQPNRAAPFGI